MPFRFDKKKESTFHRQITNKDELNEIKKIQEMLNPDEEVLLVARQSKIKPGGSHFSPNTIYATDRRLILRDPYMLGIKENVVDIPYDIITSVKLEKGLLSSTIRFKAPGLVSSKRLGMVDSIIEGEGDPGGAIEAIPKGKADDLIEIIRSGMASSKKVPNTNVSSKQYSEPSFKNSLSNPSISIADEIRKLSILRDEGRITEEEYQQVKKDLLSRK